MNFDFIWYSAFLLTPYTVSDSKFQTRYPASKRKFENIFCYNDNSKKLLAMLQHTGTCDLVYEIPKGRKQSNKESDYNCAIRETREEVGLSPRDYHFEWGVDPVYHQHVDGGVKYVYKYFVAKTEVDPKMKLINPHQVIEVSDIQYFSMEEIKKVLPLTLCQKIESVVSKKEEPQ
jgi:8-oxo-dGTP pyrophosphatase MutT (NUDIX family)